MSGPNETRSTPSPSTWNASSIRSSSSQSHLESMRKHKTPTPSELIYNNYPSPGPSEHRSPSKMSHRSSTISPSFQPANQKTEKNSGKSSSASMTTNSSKKTRNSRRSHSSKSTRSHGSGKSSGLNSVKSDIYEETLKKLQDLESKLDEERKARQKTEQTLKEFLSSRGSVSQTHNETFNSNGTSTSLIDDLDENLDPEMKREIARLRNKKKSIRTKTFKDHKGIVYYAENV
eukprot:gb/GECH01012710.1/.p1 GENE.gb/GECH01012710.1/~~gb/GECH01012710.1/.p1  ORF type:complete len:232 (+),score=53.70 gb/GECH01012710.1/:1-696(+)